MSSSRTEETDSTGGLEIVKPLHGRRGYQKVLIRRASDGEVLLGESMEGEGKPERVRLMLDLGYGDVLGNLLNHENLVSMAGVLCSTDRAFGGRLGKPSRFLVWDHCDAGTLEMLFREPPVLPTAAGFLPASLCWHVVVSLLRALAWLHDGYREDEVAYVVDANRAGERLGRGSRYGVKRDTARYMADPDWMPVLHRGITPENVFFQQPRGTETYGLCKLGNYSTAHISGHVSGRSTDGLLVASAKGNAPVLEMAWMLVEGSKEIRRHPKSNRPYTQGSEYFAVGALLYSMMTSKELPDPDECGDCGCLHLEPDAPACVHDCREAVDVGKGHRLFAGLVGYAGLDGLVGELLQWHRETECPAAWEVYKVAEEAFDKWRREDADGQRFVTFQMDQRRRMAAVYDEAERQHSGRVLSR